MPSRRTTPPAAPAGGDRGFTIQKTYAHIREEILLHRVRPGVKLTAEHYAASLAVSRTPVRQALERLCQEGYVTRIPARGYYVAEIDATEAHDLYDVRHALEMRALETAFERGIDPAGLARLTELNAQYRRSLADPKVINRSQIDQEFHLALAGLSRNAVIVRMLRDVYDRLNLRRRNDGYWFWQRGTQRGPGGASEHAVMIAALRRNDRDAALAALREHLAQARANYAAFLASSVSPPA